MPARLALGQFLWSTAKPADAESEFKAALAIDGTKARVADIQHAEGKTTEAFRTVDEVIKKHPTLGAARVVRGRLLLADGRIDEALRDAQEAVKVDPQNAEAHFLLGSSQLAKRDLDGAAKSFAEVLRLNPRAAAAQVQLAQIELQRHSLPSAIQFAEQATTLQPGNLAAQLVLARSLVASGDLDRATAVTRALVEAAPQAGVVHTQAGMLALAKRDNAGARSAFEKALSSTIGSWSR